MTEPTDGDLVGMTRGGDREAYGLLVARYQGHVYGLAYSLVDDWAEAQDIAQETFIRAYVNLDQLREPGRFAAWLRRVTFSVAVNWLKRFRPDFFRRLHGRVDLDALEIPDFAPGPPEVVEKRELVEAVQRAVASLPPKYRVPLTMFHLDGLSYQKVADFLDVPLGTAKALIHRARGKLRLALAAYTAEEVTPMVQEVLNEHKLPDEFARKVLENVPRLGWGRGRDCTFTGALEAALAATDHPFAYTDLMGFSGLAFRVRWFCGNEGARWCPSCAVGEMEEEIEAVARATGWPLRLDFISDPMTPSADAPDRVARVTADIVAAINSGRPVLAYEPNLNMDVVFGYEDGGKVLLLRDYFKPDEPLRLPPSKLGFLIIFIGDHAGGQPRRDAIIEGLKAGARNWRRVRFAEGPGEYWYGDAALERWLSDIGEAGGMSAEEQRLLCGVSWWAFSTMHDARRAAVGFLGEAASALGGEAAAALTRAARLYQQEADLLASAFEKRDAFPASAENWTPEMRQREQEMLSRAREIEEAAVTEIEQALQLTAAN